jgi:transposase
VLMNWAEEWAKEGMTADWQKLLPPREFQVLPRRWGVERSFAWICHNRTNLLIKSATPSCTNDDRKSVACVAK